MTTEKDILNFGKVYGWALYQGARAWNFHSDSGCYDSLCHTQRIKRGAWMAVYRPSRDLKNCEGREYTITFHYAHPITDGVVNALLPIIAEVDGLYLQSYNDLRRVTDGRWSAPIEEANVEEIAQIVEPLTYNADRLKMVMEIRGYRGLANNGWPRSSDSWTPRRLEVWLGEYTPHDEDGYCNYSEWEWMDENGVLKQGYGLPDDVSWFTYPSVDAVLEE